LNNAKWMIGDYWWLVTWLDLTQHVHIRTQLQAYFSMKIWNSLPKISSRGGSRELPDLPAGRRFLFVPCGLARSIFRFYIRNSIYNFSINYDTDEYKT
jgi:hypothetical protein